MKIILLKSFGLIGFTYKVEENNEITATDGNGNNLVEGVDYQLEEKDKTWPLMLVQSNGLITYAPPK